MKKVMILSWCNADNVMNYGQILQAMAMIQLVRARYTGEIDYISYHPRTIKSKIRCTAERHNPFNGHLIPYYKTKKMLDAFSKENGVRLFQISDIRKLERLSHQYDLMICGSDQIWHPRNYFPGYFLDFGSDRILRKSYAASIPKSTEEDQFAASYSQMRKSLSRFDFISVRESSSQHLVEELSGKKVDVVLDPTLLVSKEQWMRVTEYIQTPEDYIFVYIPNGMDSAIESQIDKIADSMGVRNVIILMTRGTNAFKKYKVMKFVTVGQFLYLIQNARYIFTSSFHAAVFSIIMEKGFSCHAVYDPNQGEDTRLIDLLKPLGLEDRIENGNCYKEPIDYSQVGALLAEERKQSEKILDSVVAER